MCTTYYLGGVGESKRSKYRIIDSEALNVDAGPLDIELPLS